jgi:hypothetical protein
MRDLVKEGREILEKFSKMFENSNFPDQVEGNHGIIFKKVSQSGNSAKYNIYYRGYDIDIGGHVFGSVGELERFMKNYILSTNLYNKYKHMPEKSIDEADEGEDSYYDNKDGKNKKASEEEEDSEETTDKKKPQTVADANVVLDSDLVLITTPKNIQHVKDISKDTKWMMVGGTFYGTMFDRYKKEKYTTYFIQLKPKSPTYNDRLMRKIAVIISPSNQITAYDSFDGMIDISKIYKITNTSRNLYKKLT